MITSTLPQQLRPIARSHQKLIYGLLTPSGAEGTKLFELIPKEVWRQEWIVNIKPVANGNKVLKYLLTLKSLEG